MKYSEEKILSNVFVSKIAWLGYEFARVVFPDKFPYQPHYSSYSEMVQQEEKDKKIKDKIFLKKYVKIFSAGSVQLQRGNYSTNGDIEEKISMVAKYDFEKELLP